jgi:hypothetical protein
VHAAGGSNDEAFRVGLRAATANTGGPIFDVSIAYAFVEYADDCVAVCKFSMPGNDISVSDVTMAGHLCLYPCS